MSSEFQLLHIPHVVLARIINSKNFPELLFFSLCSKRCNILVKTLLNKSPSDYQLTLKDQCIELHEELNEVNYQFEITNQIPKKSNSIEIFGQKTSISIVQNTTFSAYFKYFTLGYRLITDYICDLLGVDVYALDIGKNGLWMIDWVRNRQKVPIEVGKVVLPKEWRLRNHEYLNLIKNFTPTHSKFILAVPPPKFVYFGSLPKTDILRISCATWLNINHLITMDIIEFSAFDTKISSSDFNRFLKNWLAGRNNRLRVLVAHVEKKLDERVVLEGLKDKIDVVDEEREYQGISMLCKFNDGYDIRRNDGVTASIWFRQNAIAFVVWPDSEDSFYE